MTQHGSQQPTKKEPRDPSAVKEEHAPLEANVPSVTYHSGPTSTPAPSAAPAVSPEVNVKRDGDT